MLSAYGVFSDLSHGFFLVLDGPIPGQLNPTPYFYRINFNVSLPSGLVPLGFLNEVFMNCMMHVPSIFFDLTAVMVFDVESKL
jgi:hypothetical protein